MSFDLTMLMYVLLGSYMQLRPPLPHVLLKILGFLDVIYLN